MKGVTCAVDHVAGGDKVSIHTPNEGSDPPGPSSVCSVEVSIHTPNEGSDGCPVSRKGSDIVSIHTPNEGSDVDRQPAEYSLHRFNPHSQ